MGDDVHKCAGRIAALAGLGGGKAYLVLLTYGATFPKIKTLRELGHFEEIKLANAIAATD